MAFSTEYIFRCTVILVVIIHYVDYLKCLETLNTSFEAQN
jgi:hypothetical protein